MYRCSRCPKEDEKRRVIDHFFRIHVPLENVPYYYTLCMFRCFTRKQLKDHVTGYKRHTKEIKELEEIEGVKVDSAPFLKESMFPYILDEARDLVKLSVGESNNKYEERKKGTAPEKVSVANSAEVKKEQSFEDLRDQLLSNNDYGLSFLDVSVSPVHRSTPLLDDNRNVLVDNVVKVPKYVATPVAKILADGKTVPYVPSSTASCTAVNDTTEPVNLCVEKPAPLQVCDISDVSRSSSEQDEEPQTKPNENGLSEVLDSINNCTKQLCAVVQEYSSAAISALDRVSNALKEQTSAFRDLSNALSSQMRMTPVRSHGHRADKTARRRHHPYYRK